MTRTGSTSFAPESHIPDTASRLRHREDVLRQSIEALQAALGHLPEEIQPSPQVARSVQAGENRWRRMAKEFEMFDSAMVAAHLGISPRNRNKASQLSRQGRLLGVQRGNRTLYPSFEFDLEAGKVRPVIGEIVKIAGDSWGSESLLQWFCAPNGFLDGGRPVDIIDKEPELLDVARKSLAEEW